MKGSDQRFDLAALCSVSLVNVASKVSAQRHDRSRLAAPEQARKHWPNGRFEGRACP